MVRVERIEKGSALAQQLLEFVKNCSWHEVREHIADMLQKWVFTEWEAVFAAVDGGRIVGMATLMMTDYYPLPDIFPYVSCIFVTEEYRGQRISGVLIDFANSYAKKQGFDKTYIPTDHAGLYEKYGYRYVRDIVNYGGGTDRLYVKEI